MSGMIDVILNTINGKKYDARVHINSTVLDLKNVYQQKDGIPPEKRVLYYDCRVLSNDNETLYNCGIQQESKIYMAFRLPGGI